MMVSMHWYVLACFFQEELVRICHGKFLHDSSMKSGIILCSLTSHTLFCRLYVLEIHDVYRH